MIANTHLMDVLSATDETDRAEPCSILLQGSLCSSYNFWVGLQHIMFNSGISKCASYCNFRTDCIVITNIAVLISPASWSRVLPEKLTGPQLLNKFIFHSKGHLYVLLSKEKFSLLNKSHPS